MTAPSIPKGTRDFLPKDIVKREYVFETIRNVFRKFAFQQIETPSLEKLTTLTGKYGDEGDQLMFKVLSRGDKFKKALNVAKSTDLISESLFAEEALRYDLTVPFARYIVQHQNDINFPFKRFQIQPVWRADRPQKGRYREFYQCDADVVGSKSLMFEVELIQIISEVLNGLKLTDYIIEINNRKILSAIMQISGEENNFNLITTIIDKQDKIGSDNVISELKKAGIGDNCISLFKKIFELNGSNSTLLKWLLDNLKNSSIGLTGIEEIKEILNHLEILNLESNCKLNLTLARGLNYYTGSIIEVKLTNAKIGSIVGGGRYDELTSIFGLKDVSGVGISFGADRICDVLNERDLFPKAISSNVDLLLVTIDDSDQNALKLASFFRENEISTSIYPSGSKLKKQVKYANQNNIPYLIFVSNKTTIDGSLEFKNMQSGEQKFMSKSEVLKNIQSNE
ncbi:MAG: histidine--tRNA ligase [Crocinitomicaceae bacterium]|nr:histidine--tRNA ligase [Crocinitomicaceae bacterium]